MNHTDVTEPEMTWQGDSEASHPLESPVSASLPADKASFLLPALLLLLVGGLIGYLIGRQSATGVVAETAVSTIAPTAPAAGGPGNDNTDPASITPETLRALGDPNAPVTIVEFSDYQCPFCFRHFQGTMPQLKAEYIDTGRVYYVFKDFPITSLHPVAPRIHVAARCAGEIGGSDGYWQAHDSFFSNNQQLTDLPQPDLDNMLVRLTNEVEIDEEAMRECLASGRYTDAVTADVAEGQQLGVEGTPSFFINGYPVSGAQPYNVFQQVIALAEDGRLAEVYSQASGPNDGKAQATATALAARPIAVPLGDEPAIGPPDAPVTIVEYSDFQCPFCLRHFQQTLPLIQSYIDAGQVRYVFKDFPIHSLHPQAQKAHESARCARELGGDEAFWTMHDMLFAGQEQWAGNPDHVDVYKSFAREMELPLAEFNECLDSGRYADAVNAQVNEGAQLGVRGTPSFFINGQLLVGAQPFAVFQQAIETLLADGSS